MKTYCTDPVNEAYLYLYFITIFDKIHQWDDYHLALLVIFEVEVGTAIYEPEIN